MDAGRLAPVPDQWPWWDGTPMEKSPFLRWGFTTGACVAAVLTASLLEQGSAQACDSILKPLPPLAPGQTGWVRLLFGDNRWRLLPLGPQLPQYPGFCVLRKNAGDDPDCTHGLLVAGRMQRVQERTDNAGDTCSGDARDVVLRVGQALVVVHSLEGTGLVTLSGLDAPVGHWAINLSARELIARNLARAGLDSGVWRADIALCGGAALAARTLNPSLGVQGGLSILGTTGLVRPFSHEAYAASLRMSLRLARQQSDCVVLGTGTRTLRAARTWCAEHAAQAPHHPLAGLPPASFVAIADFVQESLEAVGTLHFRRLVLVCMPGKLLKIAAGCANTHAHKVPQAMALLARLCDELFPEERSKDGHRLATIAAAPSMRKALEELTPAQQDRLLTHLGHRACARLNALLREGEDGSSPPCLCALLLVNVDGSVRQLFTPPGWQD